MSTTNNIQNDENKSDGKLKDLFGKEMPYQVPDGYFEDLPKQVLESCRQQPYRRLYLQKGFLRIVAAAAVLIMAALVITMVFTQRQSETESSVEYSMKEIYLYNINNLADMEETYLLSLIDDDSTYMTDILGGGTPDVSDEIIMEYLLAENHIEYHIINEY